MGSMSIWHWLLFLAVALLMFGGGNKISSIMGDTAKGIKAFKKGLADDDDAPKKADGTPGDKPGDKKTIEASAAKAAEQKTASETRA
jgi:sec-independent protein translocase protein TatA